MSFFAMSSVKKYCFCRPARIPASISIVLLLFLGLVPGIYAEGLNCETSFPTSTLWNDYYDDVGDYVLFHDDECELSVNLEPFGPAGIGTTVKKELRPFPHRFVLGLFLKTDGISLGHGASVTVFRAADTRSNSEQATGWPDPDSIVELRVEGGSKGSQRLRALVKDGSHIHSQYVTGYSSRGTHLEIDVSKSTMAESEDGLVEVRVVHTQNEYEPAVFSYIDLWDRLPAVLETGAVDSYGFEGFGRLEFQPGELSQQFFVATPQVPPM